MTEPPRPCRRTGPSGNAAKVRRSPGSAPGGRGPVGRQTPISRLGAVIGGPTIPTGKKRGSGLHRPFRFDFDQGRRLPQQTRIVGAGQGCKRTSDGFWARQRGE